MRCAYFGLVALLFACKGGELELDTLDDTASTASTASSTTAPAYPEANDDHGGFAPGVTIGKISAYQVMETKLANNGNQPNNTQIPLVRDRDALVRVFLEPSKTSPLEIYGELTLERNGEVEVLQRTKTLRQASTDEKMGSTMNFDLPGSWVGSDLSMDLQLFDAALDGGAPELCPLPAQDGRLAAAARRLDQPAEPHAAERSAAASEEGQEGQEGQPAG